jgi:hypothetical protein
VTLHRVSGNRAALSTDGQSVAEPMRRDDRFPPKFCKLDLVMKGGEMIGAVRLAVSVLLLSSS